MPLKANKLAYRTSCRTSTPKGSENQDKLGRFGQIETGHFR